MAEIASLDAESSDIIKKIQALLWKRVGN
jgi:hypothetical protein